MRFLNFSKIQADILATFHIIQKINQLIGKRLSDWSFITLAARSCERYIKRKKRKQEGSCVAGCILWPVFQLVSSRWKRRQDGKNVGTVGNAAAPPDLLYLLSHRGRQRLSHQSGSCLWRYLSSLVICLVSSRFYPSLSFLRLPLLFHFCIREEWQLQ